MVQSHTLSIIILSYNREDVCRNLVKFLNKELTDSLKYEVIVLDNGSKDAYKFVEKNCHIVKFSKNVVVPQARNAAVACAQGEYVLMLDDDVGISGFSINYLLSFMKAHPDVDMVFPQKKDIYRDGTERYYGFFEANIFGNLKNVSCWFDGDFVDFGSMVYVAKKDVIHYDYRFGMNQYGEQGYAIREESAMQAKVNNKRACPHIIFEHYVDHYSGGASKDKIAYWTGYGNALFIKEYLTLGRFRACVWLCTYGLGHFVLNKFNFNLFKGWKDGVLR